MTAKPVGGCGQERPVICWGVDASTFEIITIRRKGGGRETGPSSIIDGEMR